MAKLTKRTIDGLQPRDKDYFEWDDELSGFGIRIWPTGKKTYVAQYRVGKQTRRFKIGSHGALTVDEARKQARTVLGDVARGEDPQQDRSTRRKSLTVKDLCDLYFEAADKGLVFGKRGMPKKASTLYVDRGRANRHIIPLLGSKLVQDLTTADAVKMMRDVTVGKTALSEKTDKLRGMSIVAKQRKQKDPIVNVMLNGGRVTSGFRTALFAAASRAGVSVNEFVLTAAAEKLCASGSRFSGVFEPGDIPHNVQSAA